MAADYKDRALTTADRLALAGVAVLGTEFAADAFRLARNIKTTNEKSFKVMVSKWLNSDAAKEFLATIHRQYAESLIDDIDENQELTDKQLAAIVQRGILTEKDAKKQSEMSLKLLSFRKADKAELPDEERRRFVLPWLSHCHSCILMKVFQNIPTANLELQNRENYE